MTLRPLGFSLLSLCIVILSGCGGSPGGGGSQGGSLSVSLSNTSPLVFPSQPNASITATLTRTGNTGNLTLAVTGLPGGAAVRAQAPGMTNSGSITVGAGTAPAGATTQIGNAVTGHLQLAMSTSFQPAEWDYQFFNNFPVAVAPLSSLEPQHIRPQPISQGIPQRTPTTWNFSIMDPVIQPVLKAADHIVQYYNTGGFTNAGGTFHKSPSPYPITWWGIYNEPNINKLTALPYTQLYNATVRAMQAIDPALKFVAIELADFSG
jgi:hypothetical protein